MFFAAAAEQLGAGAGPGTEAGERAGEALAEGAAAPRSRPQAPGKASLSKLSTSSCLPLKHAWMVGWLADGLVSGWVV